MAAAVVELDALPDAVGSAAKDDHFGFVRDADFVFRGRRCTANVPDRCFVR